MIKALRLILPAAVCWALFCQTAIPSVYIVKKDDTIWGIAKQFGVRTDQISKINDLMSSRLKVGQKIMVPDRIRDYKVRPGDNLIRIARDQGSSVSAIILYNNLPNETVYAGMILHVPVLNKSGTDTRPSAPAKTAPVRRQVIIHRVQKGDTLTGLSERYNVSISEIMSWNRMKSDAIYVGKHLKIHTDPPDQKEERIEAAVQKSGPGTSSWLSPSDYQFPIDRASVDRVARSGRGLIIYMDGRTDIRSIGQGVVEYAGPLTGYNQIVIVNYGNEERAVFGFLSSLAIREGQTVDKGQVIGSVEQASYSPQIQFYLELRKGKDTVDASRTFPFLKSAGPLALR